MNYSVEISDIAKNDLREIFEYIAFSLLSPENAVSQLERLEKSIFQLDSMPRKFRLFDQEPWKSHGVRIMPVDNFVVFYIPKEEIKTVTVLRVMYGRRNIDKKISLL